MHGAEVVPNFGNGVLRLDKDADGNAHSHDDQADAEQGIDFADDLIDRQECGDKVVHQHENQPEQGGSDNAGGAAVFEQGHDEAGGADSEHGAHHDKQHHAEHAHDVLHEAAQINAGDLRDRGTAVALTHHAGEVIVNTAGEDGAERNPQKHDGPPQSALKGTKDGAKAGNVQQLNHKQLPLGKNHVVHAVIDFDSGGLAVIGPESPLHQRAVDEVAADQNCQTDEKTDHC